MHLIVTGEVHSGKTTWCSKLAQESQARRVPVGGILCYAVFEGGMRIGYDATNLLNGITTTHARLLERANFAGEQIGSYRISDAGVRFAVEAIERALFNNCELVFIDEIGSLEIKGTGIMPAAIAAYQYPCRTVTVVRRKLLPAFIACLRRYSIPPQFEIHYLRSDAAVQVTN